MSLDISQNLLSSKEINYTAISQANSLQNPTDNSINWGKNSTSSQYQIERNAFIAEIVIITQIMVMA